MQKVRNTRSIHHALLVPLKDGFTVVWVWTEKNYFMIRDKKYNYYRFITDNIKDIFMKVSNLRSYKIIKQKYKEYMVKYHPESGQITTWKGKVTKIPYLYIKL